MDESVGSSKVLPLSPALQLTNEVLAAVESFEVMAWTNNSVDDGNSSFLVTTCSSTSSSSSSSSSSSCSSVDHSSMHSNDPTLGQFFVAAVQSLVIVFTLLGNGLVVGAVASFHRLRSVTNYFVVSLSVADLAVAVFVMPYSVLYDIWSEWVFGWVLCYFWISCDVMCCTASILHLCVIAVDRYLAITEPLTYATRLSSRRPGLFIAGIWTCSAAISFVPIYTGWFADGTVVLHAYSPVCGLHVNQVYAVISSTTSFYLPLVVMVIVYAKIFCIARRQSREIVKLEKSLDRDSGGGCGGGNHGNDSSARGSANARRHGRDLKAIKTLGTLMGLFCVCWLPFFIVYVVKPFCEPTTGSFPSILMLTITWLGYCNSFINPCVYGLINKDFRFAYKRLLLCQQRSLHLDHRSTTTTTQGGGIIVVDRSRTIYNAVAVECGAARDGREQFARTNEYELK